MKDFAWFFEKSVWQACRMGRKAGAGFLLALCLSCGNGGLEYRHDTGPVPGAALIRPETAGPGKGGISLEESLEEIAEIERGGGFFQGMGLAESGIREDAGDYGGAVIAAYKELAWSYAYGGTARDDMAEGLGRLLELYPEETEEQEGTVRAARGILAFHGDRWEEAEELLRPFAEGEDPDSFSRWLLLVCALEKGEGARETRAAYGAIRARYERFPEYWYRGARTFTGTIAGEYAERCINLNPRGPFAEECRGIIARGIGILPPDGAALRSRAEIEEIISRSAAAGEPEILVELFPLMELPDNAYTLYALGALRALRTEPRFLEFFNRQSLRVSGRLAERLAYISRG